MNYTTYKNVSQLTGKAHEMTFPIPYEDFVYALSRWKNGTLIQDAFPTLSAEEREFIMTGITPEEWASTFGPVEF